MSVTTTGLPAYFTCHSALKAAGGKMAEYVLTSIYRQVFASREEGHLMDENYILSLGIHDVGPLNIYF